MSTLAMILTAAIVVPGDVPKMGSGKVAEPQRLDLSGEWEGRCIDSNGCTFEGKIKGSVFVLTPKETPFVDFGPPYVSDEGNGKFKLRLGEKGPLLLGIYKHEGDKLTICLSAVKDGWPTQFKVDRKWAFLTFYYVKPRK